MKKYLPIIKNLAITFLAIYAIGMTADRVNVTTANAKLRARVIKIANENNDLTRRVDYLTEECNHRDAILDELGYKRPETIIPYNALEVK